MKTTSAREGTHSSSNLLVLLLTALWSVCASNALAQGTAFTYQGRLTAGGAPAHGLFDLRFALYDAPNTSATLLAGPLTNAATGVSNGLFTVTLDFGPGAFTGAGRWLQVDVCTNGSGWFTPLDPRQALTPAPYAIAAGTVSAPVPASQLSGVVPLAQLPGALLTNSATSATLAGAFSGSFGGSFSGDGSGLTNLSAAHFATPVLTNGQSGVTLAGTFSGDGAGLTNVQNVWLPQADSGRLVLAGFGPNWQTITNDGNGSYLAGPTLDASAANGTYYWDSNSRSYTNSGGYGVYFEPNFTGLSWLTNAAFPLVLGYNAWVGSGIGAATLYEIQPYVGQWFQGDLSRVYPGAVSYYPTNYTLPAFTGASLTQLLSNNTYKGSFVGDLSGGTNLNGANIQSRTVVGNALDNALWESVQVANLAFSTTNLNRYNTSNTFWAIRNNQPLTVLLCGNGWIEEATGEQFGYVTESLKGMYGIRGFLSPAYGLAGPATNIVAKYSGALGYSGKTATWWAPYVTLSGKGSGFTVQFNTAKYPRFQANQFGIYYVQTAGGADFQVWTNGGSGAGLLTTRPGASATTAGNYFRWTQGSVSGAYVIGITNTGVGINNFVAFEFINTNVAGGVVIAMQTQQGTSPTEYERCPAEVRAPIYQAWNPTLVLDLWSCYDTDPDYAKLKVFYKTNTPNADVLVCTQFQPNYPGPPDPNGLHWICAKTNGYPYFCGIRSVDNYGLWLRGGLAGDGGHLSAYGQTVYGKLVWAFLGLTERH